MRVPAHRFSAPIVMGPTSDCELELVLKPRSYQRVCMCA